MVITPGTKLGRYEIRSKIGQGGMGEVYLAEDTTLHRQVAIKFIPVAVVGNEQANKRFLREAQTAARLDHPNICVVHEVAEESGRSFIVMQYVAGETLDLRMKRAPLSVSESLSIAVRVADALAHSHEREIIHRDMKPSNIMITSRGQVKVMDFGLARSPQTAAVAKEIDAEASTQALLTTPGTIIGTVPYMSPEQTHGQALDARTDIFSFGVTLYEMLTGQQPFAANSPAGIISAILTREPPPVSDFITNCPPALQQILNRCLDKDREHRYQSIGEVAADLERVRRECDDNFPTRQMERNTGKQFATTVGGRVSNQQRLMTPRMVLVLATIILAGVALVAYTQFFPGSHKTPTVNSSPLTSSASDSYLRAKVLLTNENQEDTDNAIKLLQDAVAADPNLALVWIQLARAYNIKAFYYTPQDAKQLNLNAQFANEKALAIDPNLAEAHFVRGLLLWTHANRFPHESAIQSYKQAIKLKPDIDEAHHQLGLVYFHIGLLDKGWAEIERAVAINPNNTLARFRFGVIYLYRGQYEDALRVFNSTSLDRNPLIWAFQTATAMFHLGRSEEALKLIDKYLMDYPKDEGGLGASVRAMIFAQAGKFREAEEAIEHARQVGANFGHFHHTAYNIACAYALMNKPEQAVEWLRTAADDGFPCYPLFESDVNLKSLRTNRAFLKFMGQIKQQWNHYKSTL